VIQAKSTFRLKNMLAKHIKIIVICNIHDGQFRQNSHLLAAIHFNGMSFQLQIIITIMINTWLNALCTGKKSIQLSTQWVILCVMMHVIVMYNIVFIARDAASKILTFLNANYNRNCLIRHRLICQFTEFVLFCRSCQNSYLLCTFQFAQFVTSFYPLEAFCSTNTSFAVWLLMSKQPVRVGIQTN